MRTSIKKQKKTHLKLKAIIERGRLNLSAATDLLSHPEAFPGMPPAGSQGAQREFSLRQATQLAIAAHLVRSGVSLEDCATIVEFAEKTAQSHQGPSGKRVTGNTSLFSKVSREDSDPWVLTICDEDLVSIFRRSANPDFLTAGDFFNFHTGEEITYDAMDSLRIQQVNVSLLEHRLSRNLGLIS